MLTVYRRKMMRKLKGFTLVELMIALTVAAIVLGMAVPSFKLTMLNNSSASVGGELTTALNFARSEAVKRAARISVCASDDGTTCLAANNWDKGWLVFVDDAIADTTATVTVGTILRYWDDLPEKVKVSALKGAATNIQFVRFTSSGTLARTNAADAEARKFIVYVEGCKGKSSVNIRVGLSGMLSPEKIDCP